MSWQWKSHSLPQYCTSVMSVLQVSKAQLLDDNAKKGIANHHFNTKMAFIIKRAYQTKTYLYRSHVHLFKIMSFSSSSYHISLVSSPIVLPSPIPPLLPAPYNLSINFVFCCSLATLKYSYVPSNPLICSSTLNVLLSLLLTSGLTSLFLKISKLLFSFNNLPL